MLLNIVKKFASSLILVTITPTTAAFSQSFTVNSPAYEKWGSFAMEATKHRYPAANIVDYLYVGHEDISANQAKETFKFWLKQDSKEWGVYVKIMHFNTPEKVISVTFQEVNR